jgi:hypothetical protein
MTVFLRWIIPVGAFLTFGVIFRRFLDMGSSDLPATARGIMPLGPERDAIYEPVASEIRTQTDILGISLNDAFDERARGRDDISWPLVNLAGGQWARLADLVERLLAVSTKHLPNVRGVVPIRPMNVDAFSTRVLVDQVRMHELIDRLVFSSKMRFQLQLRVLRRASLTLNQEFQRTYQNAQRIEDRSPEVWRRLDLYFHDFDIVAKQFLLAVRTLLACLPHPALEAFAADISVALGQSVRTAIIPSRKP